MLEVSTLFKEAPELLDADQAIDLSGAFDTGQLLEQVGVDLADFGDLADSDTDALMSPMGLDGETQAVDVVLSNFGIGQ